MATWTDNTGREWRLEFTVGTSSDVKKRFNIDFRDAYKPGSKGDVFAKLFADPNQVAEVLWTLCRVEARKLNITEEDFYHLVGGQQIRDGMISIAESLVEYHNPGHGARAAEKMRAFIESAGEQAEKRLDEFLDKIGTEG
jgi:hypothetical protein